MDATSKLYTYANGYTIQRERLNNGRELWRMERNGRLIAHYRTKNEAEAHGPALNLRNVPWLGV